jgi:hypothetical protein
LVTCGIYVLKITRKYPGNYGKYDPIRASGFHLPCGQVFPVWIIVPETGNNPVLRISK